MEAIQGKKIVYLYRLLSEAATADGAALAFTTENGRTKSKEAESTATKDGPVRTPGIAEAELTATSILAKGDTPVSYTHLDVYKRQSIYSRRHINRHFSLAALLYTGYHILP